MESDYGTPHPTLPRAIKDTGASTLLSLRVSAWLTPLNTMTLPFLEASQHQGFANCLHASAPLYFKQFHGASMTDTVFTQIRQWAHER